MQQVEFIIKLLELSADIKELKHSFRILQVRNKNEQHKPITERFS